MIREILGKMQTNLKKGKTRNRRMLQILQEVETRLTGEGEDRWTKM